MNKKWKRSYTISIIPAMVFLSFALSQVFYSSKVVAATLPPPTPTVGGTVFPKLAPTPLPTTGPTPTRYPTLSNFTEYTDNVKLHLSQLEYSEMVLDFPEAVEFYVKLPDQWQVKATSTFTMHYTLYDQIQESQMLSQYYSFDPPAVRIYVNDFMATTFNPKSGKDQYFTFEIPLQVTDRVNTNPDNEFTFRFEFVDEHDFYCGYVGLLTMHEDSYFNVNYDFMLPTLDLSRFPSPISQNSSIPETIYFVVPDNFNSSDLSAAATTAAMINKTTDSFTTYKIVRESDRLGIPNKANLVVIGTPARNAFLREVLYRRSGTNIGMPSSLASGNRIYVNSADRLLADDEGLIQLMPSIMDPHYSYMVVTGNTDESVQLAAKGLSSPPIGNVGAGYIVGSNFKMPPYDLGSVVTLKSLGYISSTFYGTGTYVINIPFYIPRNWRMEDGTALILRYRNSDNLDEINSGLALYVNDQPAGSVKIDVKVTGEKEVNIPINKKDIRSGWLNILRIEATSDMLKACLYNPRAFLINIQDTSMLVIPHSIITDPEELSPITHGIYYMGTNPSIYVSMPEKPTTKDLDMLMSFTSLFGALRLPTVDFHVGLKGEENLSEMSGLNVLVIGRPSTNGMVNTINEHLPQKFVNKSDALEQMVGSVAYQVPPGVSLGVMEVITSPFDPAMGLTLVSGTNEEGQQFVYNRLVQNPPNLIELEGDLVFFGNKTVKALTTFEGVQVALDIASSSVTGTQVALQVVPTGGNGTLEPVETKVPKYVSTVTVENPVSQMLGKYLLVGLLVSGSFILLLAVIRTARGGRRS